MTRRHTPAVQPAGTNWLATCTCGWQPRRAFATPHGATTATTGHLALVATTGGPA